MIRKKGNRYRSDNARMKKEVLRWLKTVVGVAVLFVAVLLLSAGLSHSYFALLDGSWLRVEEIQIQGAKHVDRHDILNALGVPRSATILSLKMSRLAARLNTLPWLKSAVVRLDFPGRIVVEVTERQPLAVVAAEDSFLLDTEGKLFARRDPEEKDVSALPVFTGFAGANIRQGSELPEGPFEMIKRLLAALDKSRKWLPPEQVKECRWQGDEGFALSMAQNNISVQLGSEAFEQRLDRLHRILGLLAERQWMEAATRIDLDYPNRAYVEGQFPHAKGTRPL